MAVRVTRAGVGLTIGIIILALVVLGGLYIVKQRGEQARRDEAITIAKENLETQSSDKGALNEGTNNTNTADEGGASEMPASNGGDVATSQLPQTGPGDFLAFVGVALLVFVGTSYLRSRQLVLKRHRA